MELIALGSYGPYPKEGTATSGYLLKVGEGYYLFDMGSGVYARLLQYVEHLDDLKAIFLTHLHFDHISDISVFKYAVGFKTQKGLMQIKPQLFHPKSPELVAESLKHGETFEHHYIDQDFVYQDDAVKITFYLMEHPVETYGVRVEAEGKIFAYTSDTAYFHEIRHCIQDADLLVINCGYQNKDKPDMPFHLSTADVSKLVKNCNVKRALATHLFAENVRAEIEQELNSYMISELELIQELKIYSV